MIESLFILAGASFATFCIWLTVRLINRRERWAKRTAIALLVGILFGYPLSWRPAIYVYHAIDRPAWMEATLSVYEPLVWLLNSGRPWIFEPYRSYIFWFIGKAQG